MLSLYKLEIFHTVVQSGSFSKAAKVLLLTQPAVSQHMQDLESSLGVVLFVRSSRGVKLTEPGEILHDYTKSILDLVAQAENKLAETRAHLQGLLQVGATPGAGTYLLPNWLQAFKLRHPGISVSIRTDTTQSLAEALQAGRLDLAIVEGELPEGANLRVQDLRPIELCVVVHPAHPWHARAAIHLQELAGQPFITRPAGSQTRSWVDQIFQTGGITANIIAEFDQPEGIKQAVAAGMGITILPDWAVAQERSDGKLFTLLISGTPLQRTLKLLQASGKVQKPPALAFIKLLGELI